MLARVSRFQSSLILKEMLKLNMGIPPAFVFKGTETASYSRLVASCFDGGCSASETATSWDEQWRLYARTASDL